MGRGQRPSGDLRYKPPHTVARVLAWADDHRKRTGAWPGMNAGAVLAASGENWSSINSCLRIGNRGFPGGSSLLRFLEKHRGVRDMRYLPRLTYKQVLAWADDHQRRTEAWPSLKSGPVLAASGETWRAVNTCLRLGNRGFPGGSSLAQLLAKHRGVRTGRDAPRFTIKQILAWADAHRNQTGAWPTQTSGTIPASGGDTWHRVNNNLQKGGRGLAGGSSLAQLLQKRRGYRNHLNLPKLIKKRIVAWAVAHHHRTGKWPTRDSGPVWEAPGETWNAIAMALSQGHRGFPGGSSLARLLDERCRGRR